MADTEEEYVPPMLAELFHKLPHLNIAFRTVNSTFNPSSELYLESLGILASLPAAWLILTLLVLLIYLLTRCCERHPRRKRSIAALKWTLAIFTLLCCGAVAVGLYGNDDVHNGLVQFVAAIRGAHTVVYSVVNQTAALETSLDTGLRPQVAETTAAVERSSSPMNATVRSTLLSLIASASRNASAASAAATSMSSPLRTIATFMDKVGGVVELAETFRWPVTMAVLSILLVFCIILLFGVARHSRCALITFSVFGLFAVIVSWLLASLYLASSVALGDLCVAPAPYLEQRAASLASSPAEAAMLGRLSQYYLRCDSPPPTPVPQATPAPPVGRAGPLMPRLRDAQRSLLAVEAGVAQAVRIAPQDIAARLDALTSALDRSRRLAATLPALLDCRTIHRHYSHAAKSVCDLGLYGLAFMLLSCLAAGLFFTVLVWVDSHTWIYIRKRRDYLQVDEQDPFLPPTSSASLSSASRRRSQGSYGSAGNGRPAREEKPHHHHHHQRGQHGSSSSSGHHHSHHRLHSGTGHGTSTSASATDGGPGGGGAGGSGSSAVMLGPNNGQYPTLSKQCKTLESADFY